MRNVDETNQTVKDTQMRDIQQSMKTKAKAQASQMVTCSVSH